MNRRLALRGLLSGVAAATTVSAKDFDPYIGNEESPECCPTVQGSDEYKPDLWDLKHQLPPRIKAGVRWLERADRLTIDEVLEDNRQMTYVLFLPRSINRWFQRHLYLKKLDAWRPDLTESEWASCKEVHAISDKIRVGKGTNLFTVMKAMNDLIEK